LWIRLHRNMGDYFQKTLPAIASKLEWHSIERNVHGMANDINYYVAGQLMWDRHCSIKDLVRHFCESVFGGRNADNVGCAYWALEDIRQSPFIFGAGNDPHDLALVDKALAKLDAVHLAAEHHSRIPTSCSPQEVVEQLKSSLREVRKVVFYRAITVPSILGALESGDLPAAKLLQKQADKMTFLPLLGSEEKAVYGELSAVVQAMLRLSTAMNRSQFEQAKWMAAEIRVPAHFPQQERAVKWIAAMAGKLEASKAAK
jgi:hypothetical protein